MRKSKTIIFCSCMLILGYKSSKAQQSQFNLSDAIRIGLANYQNIKAKRDYTNASAALVQNVKNQYLPDVTASIQQAYGTVNGQFGPYSSVAGASTIASSGPPYTSQSWTAAFGSIYLINTNWEFVSFGKLQSKIDIANKQLMLDSANLTQEKFVQGIKIAGAYLNLLIAQRVVRNAKANVNRADYVQQTVLARTKSGLNPGVDSSIANADLSAAKLVLIQAISNEQQQRNQLCRLINIPPIVLMLDTSYFSSQPLAHNTNFAIANNPQVEFYKNRVNYSLTAEKYLQKSINPGLNLFGAFQGKGSGFDYNFMPQSGANYSKNYVDGISPSRYNYIVGIGIGWNIMSLAKIKQQVKAQQFITEAYKNEYDLISTQLQDQLLLSDQQIENSINSIKEVPVEYKAASDAYLQKTVLYKNGLTNIVDVQQALYNLNRAETDLGVAYINIWQALLLKAAASGDFDLFMMQVK
ncbi:MAG: TolC family protein [Bacteroidetes bacterium]|nr:TolC family protein [Bacteroidota bacterium]MBS1974295.1 TolC family protein [Bacteroidota bacterium]